MGSERIPARSTCYNGRVDSPRALRRIRPPSGFAPLDIAEIWAYRDLLRTLAERDLTLRYRQTALGVAWVLFQPIAGAGLLTFVFGKIAGLDRGMGYRYFLLTLAGQILYAAFAGTLTKASTSLVGSNTWLITKVYFPRLVLPLSAVASCLIDFGVGLCLLLPLLLLFHVAIGVPLLTLPLWLALTLLLSLGWGLIAAALMPAYRDVAYILPVLMQMLNLGSPVGWTLTRIPPRFLPAYLLLNPLATLLEGFRWSLFGGAFPVPAAFVVYAAAVAVAVFVAGAAVFRSRERRFADVL